MVSQKSFDGLLMAFQQPSNIEQTDIGFPGVQSWRLQKNLE